MPFTVATNGDVSFPGNVTFAGNSTVKGGLAVTGQTTVTGLNLTQNLSVNSLTVNGALQASNITATGSLISNANTNLGGTVTVNGNSNSAITAETLTGRKVVIEDLDTSKSDTASLEYATAYVPVKGTVPVLAVRWSLDPHNARSIIMG